MAYTCSNCGTTYASGWKCTNCEQNQLLRQSMEQQSDLMEKSRRDAAYEARMNREMQEEQAERAERQARAVQMEAELESWIKQIFAEVALLIQTSTTETVGQKVEEFINKANAELSAETYETTGGIFTPKFANYFRNNLTDYIINNPAKAAEIAIAKQVFESHAKTAKEIWNANEAREAENRRIKKEQERAEQAIKDEQDAVTDAEKRVLWKKAQYGAYFFMLMLAVLAYANFKESKLFTALLCAVGAFIFALFAWVCGGEDYEAGSNAYLKGFVKGMKR